MYVDTHDTRPSSLLYAQKLDSAALTGGAVFLVGAHVLVPAAFFTVLSMLALSSAGEEPPPELFEEHVIAAHFVQLGRKPDPKKLPQRKVPRKTTAPDKAVVVSKDMDPPKPKKEDEERPDNPEIDDLARLGDRAQMFSEITDMEREGDPEGLVDGTETDAQEGDLYRGKLVAFFKRGWTIPTTLGDTRGLRTTATVTITQSRHVGPSTVVKGSGVPLFDQSVEDRFQQLRASGAMVPEPPASVAHQFLGQTIAVRFNGRRVD